jgi:SAM-dependent methyltransferase
VPTEQVHPQTYWERKAATRWGSYLTEVERQTLEFALQQFAEPNTAVDIGCEGGRWSQILSNLGWKLICIDVNPQTLAICRQRLPEADCILVRPDDKRLPVNDESADLILCVEVPMVDHDWFFQEMFRVLRPGGVIVGTHNNRRSYRGLLANIAAWFRGTPYYYETAYSQRRRVLKQLGFAIQGETGYCWFPFGRGSNSKLVPYCAALEKFLRLHRFAAISPWVAFAAKKTFIEARQPAAIA